MVTQEQAIEIAKKELVRHGYAALDYDTSVDSETSGGQYWMIWFDKKGPFPIPGGRHIVRVNKATGHPDFMRGE